MLSHDFEKPSREPQFHHLPTVRSNRAINIAPINAPTMILLGSLSISLKGLESESVMDSFSKLDVLDRKSSFDDHKGVRCIRDGFSITQFNEYDWNSRNKETFEDVKRVLKDSDRNRHTSKTISTKMVTLSQKMQQENSAIIRSRAKLINERKTALAASISAITDEITALEEDEIRLQNSLIALGIPESITKECLEKRSYRPEAELILDNPESELIKEITLISEIKIQLQNALTEIKEQRIENRNARQRLEYDWSDKCKAYEIEAKICSLNNSSGSIMFQPGVTRTPTEQSSEQFWELVTRETLEECEKCRIKSINLRSRITSMILCVTRDLRIQADNTERALTNRINCTQEVVRRLEIELEECLKKLVENENCIQKMLITIRSFEAPTKVAHTRLDNRIYRPHFESCNDHTQKGLIEEVVTIENAVSNLSDVLKESEKIKNEIIQNRVKLEREIMLKRKTIMLDGERCTQLRSRYPSATTLSGFINE
ncbi:tektin-4 [Eupeodes corollae]|uniref:tektin-4 n=1 Tax=Eupeodes corollae TaxID=290404 RepID=UPI0024912C55|nr:tektin-4 [Eupeodes corollae]